MIDLAELPRLTAVREAVIADDVYGPLWKAHDFE